MRPESFLLCLVWGLHQTSTALAHPLGLDGFNHKTNKHHIRGGGDPEDPNFDDGYLHLDPNLTGCSSYGRKDVPIIGNTTHLLQDLVGLRIVTTAWMGDNIQLGSRTCVEDVCWCVSSKTEESSDEQCEDYGFDEQCTYIDNEVSHASCHIFLLSF